MAWMMLFVIGFSYLTFDFKYSNKKKSILIVKGIAFIIFSVVVKKFLASISASAYEYDVEKIDLIIAIPCMFFLIYRIAYILNIKNKQIK